MPEHSVREQQLRAYALLKAEAETAPEVHRMKAEAKLSAIASTVGAGSLSASDQAYVDALAPSAATAASERWAHYSRAPA